MNKCSFLFKKNNFSEINWDGRFKKLGAYGLIDTRHPKNELSYVTKEQKRIIFPYFKSMLNGNEMNILDFGRGSGRFTHDKEIMEFDQGNTRFVKLLNQLLSGKEIKNYAN